MIRISNKLINEDYKLLAFLVLDSFNDSSNFWHILQNLEGKKTKVDRIDLKSCIVKVRRAYKLIGENQKLLKFLVPNLF